MNCKNILILTSLLFLTAACKKGVPDIQSLRKLSGFTLDQSSITVLSKTNPQFTVTGTCTAGFRDIEVSFDGGSTWISSVKVANPATISCDSGGTFSLSFASVSSWIRAGSPAADGVWKFRALSDMGDSYEASLNLLVQQKGQLILAGSSATTSGTFRLTSRVGGHLSASSSGGYTLKGTVKAR